MRASQPLLAVTLISLFLPSLAIAQEQPTFPAPAKEHEFLKKFAGTWETATECLMAPGQDPLKCQGQMSGRMLGGFWIVLESESTMMETRVTALQTLGFDPEKKKYIGTWVDSMFSYMWKYQGTVKGNTLTLEAEGPNFMAEGKMTRFQDIYEFLSDDEIKISSRMLMDSGEWVTMMTGSARRKPASP